MSEKVTIYDVAAKANVSTSTVSRVLNDSPKVAEPTRSRVRAAMHELCYIPNWTARDLASGTAKRNVAAVEKSEVVNWTSPTKGIDRPLLSFEGDWHTVERKTIRRALLRHRRGGTSWVLVKTRLHGIQTFVALKLEEPHWMVKANTAQELATRILEA